MELILTKKTIPHGCVEVDWSPEDDEISWVSLFYSPTDQDQKTGWSVGEELHQIFVEFLGTCMSPGSHTYAFLSAPQGHEYERIVSDVRKSSLPFVEGKNLVSGKRRLSNWLQKSPPKFIHVANVELAQIDHWYSSYAGWEDIPYVFAVTNKSLTDWDKQLFTLHDDILRKDSLRQIQWYIMNHFEHGIEAIGLTARTDRFESTAKHLSEELKVPLLIRQTGNPF